MLIGYCEILQDYVIMDGELFEPVVYTYYDTNCMCWMSFPPGHYCDISEIVMVINDEWQFSSSEGNL